MGKADELRATAALMRDAQKKAGVNRQELLGVFRQGGGTGARSAPPTPVPGDLPHRPRLLHAIARYINDRAGAPLLPVVEEAAVRAVEVMRSWSGYGRRGVMRGGTSNIPDTFGESRLAAAVGTAEGGQ
jgi:hypothetical protein